MIQIKDIQPDSELTELLARVERVILSAGSSGANYLIIHLADKSGRVEARKWTVNEADKDLLKPGAFVLLKRPVVSVYKGMMQIKVNDYEVLPSADLGRYGRQVDDFFISAPVNIDREYQWLSEHLQGLHNETYKRITLHLLETHKAAFLSYPAALTIHHNVIGGLFWHSYTLVKNALAIKDNYKYAEIDWELVVCGSILHDLGKIFELNSESASDYSLEGKLLGHISIGNAEIIRVAHELGLYWINPETVNPDVTLLSHMILASHGKQEFGSPTPPLLIEAVILSSFDQLDARIYRINEELQKVDTNAWTAKLLTEDSKFFYRHKKADPKD